MFNGKCLLITGGTGSFGNAVLKRFLDTEISEIRIFSRDEKKQEDMRKQLQNDKVKALFYLQKAVELGYNDVEWLKTDDSMNIVRNEKEFIKILKRMGSKKN